MHLLYIILLANVCVCVEITHDEIWDYIRQAVDLHGKLNPKIIEQDIQRWHDDAMDKPKVWQYIIPRILLWDPLNQYPKLLKSKIICQLHNSLFIPGNWRVKKTIQPRWIYDKSGPILLIMRSYICKCGNNSSHMVLSGEKIITDQLPECIDIPFRLSHRAGFSTDLQEEIVQRFVKLLLFFNWFLCFKD